MSCFVVRKIDHSSTDGLSTEKFERAYRKGDIVTAYKDKQCKALGVTERVQSKKHIVVKVPDMPDEEANGYAIPFKREYTLEERSAGFGQCCFDMHIDFSQSEYELAVGEGKFTVTALTEAPADNVTFIIV